MWLFFGISIYDIHQVTLSFEFVTVNFWTLQQLITQVGALCIFYKFVHSMIKSFLVIKY